MSLQLRLTLFYTLLVTGVLGVAALGLRLSMERILRGELERSLHDALTLARPLVQTDEGLRLGQEGELVPRLPPDLALLLYHSNGQLAQVLGRNPTPLPPIQPGCVPYRVWQVCAQRITGGWILATKPLEGIWDSLNALNQVLMRVLPTAVLLALLLGYPLAGRALAPVRSLTLAARQRSRERLWLSPLPEPLVHDEIHSLSQAFNTLLQTLGELIESERRFTQDAAHELRTPLTALLGRLEQAQEKNRDPEVTRVLQRAQQSAQGLLGLVEKLLLLARTEAGQGLLQEAVALPILARETVDELQPLFQAKGLNLKLEKPSVAVVVTGDRLALGLALRNLLENALKFAPFGTVQVSVRKDDFWAVIEVSDQGPGIPESALPHLFDRFYQAEVEHRRQGSGLGLALVAAIARWHGGTVAASNVFDGGARFTLRFPLA